MKKSPKIFHELQQVPFPTIPSRLFNVSREAVRLLAQMFLPSTTPANKYFPLGNPPLIRSRVLVPRTKSNPNVTKTKSIL